MGDPYLDNKLGVEAVERGVSAIGKGADRVCELPLLWDEAGDLLHKGCVAAILLPIAINVPVMPCLATRVILTNH